MAAPSNPNQTNLGAPLAHPSETLALRSAGSSLVVLHSDPTQATSVPQDPGAILSGTATNHQYIHILDLDRTYTHLDLYLYWVHASATITTSPVIHVLGRTINPGNPLHDPNDQALPGRFWPQDVNTSSPDQTSDGFWVPLVKPAYDSGSTSHSLQGLSVIHTVGLSKVRLSEPVTVHLAGVDRLMVTVETAAAFSATPTASMILGRLIS